LLAYGTDDEEALHSAVAENFDKATHLLCTNHLRKNVETRLVELSIKGKEDIIADIFGRQIGEVYQVEVVKEKWCSSHQNGSQFYEWFARNKERKMVDHVITPVCQRPGLSHFHHEQV
jgi:hypothetical protein